MARLVKPFSAAPFLRVDGWSKTHRGRANLCAAFQFESLAQGAYRLKREENSKGCLGLCMSRKSDAVGFESRHYRGALPSFVSITHLVGVQL
jgi:hypothetical protein